MTGTGEREISDVSGRLPDNPGRWHICMVVVLKGTVTKNLKHCEKV